MAKRAKLKKVLEVFFVRHAQSENNALHETCQSREEYMRRRSADPTLSSVGAAQAKALVGKLSREISPGSKVSVWTSPLTRTLLTIEPTARAFGLNPIVDVELFETYGSFEEVDGVNVVKPGKTRDAIAAEFPGYDVSRVNQDGWYAGHDFETLEECESRAARLIVRLRNEALRLQDAPSDECNQHAVVIVSHGNFLSEVMKGLLHSPDDVGYSCGNASVSKVTVMTKEGDDDGVSTVISVEYLFSVDHLEAQGIVTGTGTKGVYTDRGVSSTTTHD